MTDLDETRPSAVAERREPGTLAWLLAIMRRLLAPDGCPWDREQTLQTLRPFLLEECYEVLDALDEGDPGHHAEELGDLLFQIVFQAEVAGLPLERVVRLIGEKLIRRHPHVFGEVVVADSAEVVANWERIKRAERGDDGATRGVLAGVPRAMPALPRAHKLQHRAAKVGFDWPDVPPVRSKLLEEIGELDAAIATGAPARVAAEVGDLLFAAVNWARKLGVDPEEALRGANARFTTRFAHVERALAARGETPAGSTLAEMDALWEEAKRVERGE